jgi:hypothetical protein
MPERKDDYKRSLFLSAIATLLLTSIAAEIVYLSAPGLTRLLHGFLPLAFACYAVTFALGLLAGRRLQISRNGGEWTPAILGGAAWSGATICLSFYGMLRIYLSLILGI